MRLISARWVVPVIAPPIRDGAVVVDDGAHRRRANEHATVVAVGTRADLRRAYPGLDESRAAGVLCPALVNAHAHLELSDVAGAAPIPGGDGLVNWTRRLSTRLREQGAAPVGNDAGAGAGAGAGANAGADAGADADPGAGALRAARSARALGTAAIGDVGNGTTGWVALGRANLQGIFFHELLGSRDAATGDAVADAARERAAVSATERPAHIAAVPAPHAPYSVGPELMRRIFASAVQAGYPTTIHLAEDGDEILLLRAGTGAWPAVLRALGVPATERVPRLSPTAYMKRLGAFAAAGPPPLLVHMVHADADDRRRARESGATVVLCPRSNLHIGGRLADVPALIADGVRLAVGTDSLASVPNLSPWEELATLSAHFPQVPARTWLHAATAGGAAALALGHLGAIAPGRRPGLLDVGLPAEGDDPERALVSHGAPRVQWIDTQMYMSMSIPMSMSGPAAAPEGDASAQSGDHRRQTSGQVAP